MSEKDTTSKKAPAPAADETPLPASDKAPPSLPGDQGIAAAAVKSKIERRVFWACFWSLLALGLIAWSLLSRKPIPVIVAMSVGQVIGTLSLLLFLGSVALDVRSRYVIARRAKAAPPAADRS